MSMYTSDDPFRGFRKAHQVVKRVVVSVAGSQHPGGAWNLGNTYSDFLAQVPQHQLRQLWDAFRRLVICYDNLPMTQKSSLTEIELMANLPHIILIARHARVALGIRSLLRNSCVAPSPSHRDAMRRQAKQLAKLHGQHVQQSNELLRRAQTAPTLVGTGSRQRRRRRPSLDDSSVRTYREQRALRITSTK